MVVDNASTDDTVATVGSYFPDVELLQLPSNGGGASGFHAGFKWAHEHGYTWIWAMDDDGFPAPGALEALLAADTDSKFRGPIVLADEEPTSDALAFTWVQRHCELHTLEEVQCATQKGLIIGHLCPFNGVLVHRAVVSSVGFPNPEFFFWGDEWDYFHRVEAAGYQPVTVTQARFFHPKDRTLRHDFQIMGRRVSVMYGDSPFKNYILIRNHAYIRKTHFGTRSWLGHTVKYLVYFMFLSSGLGPIQVLRYALEGWRGRLEGHQRFLRE